MRARRRVKLRPISISSLSMLRSPSAMLIRQNGIRIATSTKITPKSPGSNQIAARIAQPIEGNELSTGLIRASTTSASAGTPWARNARPPPIASAAAIATSTRQAEVEACQRNSGLTNSSASRRTTATGPGRMNSGRLRANAHQPISASRTTPSPIRRSANAGDFASARIVTRDPGLQRTEHVLVDTVHKGDDQDDRREERRGVELLARQVDHVAEPGIAAEQLGRERHLPGHAEHDAQRREHERIERRHDHAPEHARASAREAPRHLDAL